MLMTNVKKRLMATMRKMMLNCEQASLISTREMVEKVGIKSRMGLQMHLAACKHCRKYYQQSKILSRVIQHQNRIIKQGSSQPHRLSVAERSKLQRLISNKIQS
jgi:predicted anti-sigma-YlaC factor YlaD